jgi:hypothetical protein
MMGGMLRKWSRGMKEPPSPSLSPCTRASLKASAAARARLVRLAWKRVFRLGVMTF